MAKISLPLSISLVVVGITLGLLGGYFISPAYQQNMYMKESMDLGKADRFVDLRYINAMATHHRGAILLADQIEGSTDRKELKDLANMIQEGEPKLIAELYGWKKDWYKDNRQVTDPKVVNIGGKDKNTDLRFLNALIAHHEAGIEMTQEIKTKSSRQEILDNAEAVEKFLAGSLVTLREWRFKWYNVK